MRGSRGDYATYCVAGIATALAYLWLPDLALLIVGTVVAVLAGAALIVGARRGRDWRQHQALIRELWVAAGRIPPGRVLADPGTGELLSIERRRGWLTLVVAVPQERAGPAAAAHYVIGRWGAPVRPPVRRRIAAAGDVRRTQPRQRPTDSSDADARASTREVSTAELAKLVDQVLRTAVLGGAGA